MDRVRRSTRGRRVRTRGMGVVGVLVLGVLALASFGNFAARAETITWVNPAGGGWGTTSNWDPQDVPNEAGEEAIIPAGQGTYAISLSGSYSLDRVYLNNADATLQLSSRTLTLGQPEGLVNYGTILGAGSYNGRLDQAASGRLRAPGGTTVNLYGTANNAGLIDIGAIPVTGQGRLIICTTGYTLDGPGQLVLNAEADPNMARLDQSFGTLIQGAAHTIRGAGTVSLDLTNAGQVIADRSGYTLLLSGAAKTNSALFEATNGGVLELSNITLTQTGAGQILSDAGRVRLSGGGLNGGTLNTLNGGVIESSGNPSWTNVTSLGEIRVPASSLPHLYGSATTNEGTVWINPDASPNDAGLTVAAYDHHLQGSGEVVLRTAGDVNDARISSYYGSLIQDAGHTIRGEGSVQTALANHGRVVADVPGRELQLTTAAKSNDGAFEAAGGILRLAVDVTQTAPGAIRALDGTVYLQSNVTGGSLESSGTGYFEGSGAPSLTDVSLTGRLDIPSTCNTRLYGAATTVDGRITLNSTLGASPACITTCATDHTLQGPGEILLQTPDGNPSLACITSYYGSLIQSAEHGIRGEGKIQTVLTNHGLVSADANGRTLVCNEGAKANYGILQATGGGILRLESATTQGPEGRIQAAGGNVELVGTVSGGSLASNSGGLLRWLSSSALYDVQNLGEIHVPGGSTPSLRGTGTTNDGTILVNSDSTSADAIVYVHSSYNHELQGSGEIVLQSAGSVDDARVWSYYGSLVQGAEHTIRGAGRIGLTLTNQGMVEADVSGQVLLLDSDPKTNHAIFRATGGGILRLGGATTQGPEGRIVADGGDVELQNTVTGGRIESIPGSVVRLTSSAVLADVHNLSEIHVPGGSTPSLRGTGTTNDGTILINSDSTSADAIVYIHSSYDHQLQGSGEIVLQSAGQTNDARLTQYYGSLVQGPAHTIRGAGRIQVGLTNQGMVKADVNGQTLLLDGDPKTNYGTMRAENGGVFSVGIAFTNAGLADAWSGGTFRTEVAPANYQSGTLTGGSWEVHDNSTMRLLSTNIQRVDARVLLDGPNANLYRDDGTTPGLGSLVAIEDLGDFELAGGRSFATAGNLSVNAGRLTIGAGSTLTVNGQYTQSGNGEPGMDVTSVNGVLVATTGPVVITGGRLSGTGVVQNDVQSSGWVCPGVSAGELTIGGSYTQNEPGTCYIELAGPNAGQVDHLQINGAVQLAGRLIVQAIDGYAPPVGTQFTIMNFASRTGTFTLETGSPGSGLEYTTQYYADHVTITITSAPSSVPDGDEVVEETEEEPTPGDPDETGNPVPPARVLPAEVAFSAQARTGGTAGITLALPWDAAVEVSLFDFTGRRIALLRQGPESAGTHPYTWNGIGDGGRRCPSGVYLARVRINGPGGSTARCVRTLIIR